MEVWCMFEVYGLWLNVGVGQVETQLLLFQFEYFSLSGAPMDE